METGANDRSNISGFQKSNLMNSDIYDELEMTDDITFDKELRLQEQVRAAKIIQRWFKEKKNQILENQAREEQEFLRLKKQRLYQMYVEGRDSVTMDDMRDPIAAMRSAFLGTGSIYGPTADSGKDNFNFYHAPPKSLYGLPAAQHRSDEALAYQSLGKNSEAKSSEVKE